MENIKKSLGLVILAILLSACSSTSKTQSNSEESAKNRSQVVEERAEHGSTGRER